MPITKKKLIFILSSNYSGSHFLSLLLGSHSKAVHLGETKNLVKGGLNCYTCGELNDCVLFKDINELTADSFYPELFNRAGKHVSLLIDTSKKITWVNKFIHQKNNYEIKVIHLIRDPRALFRKWKNKYTSITSQLNQRRKTIKYFPKKIFKLLFSSQDTIYLYKWLRQNQEITDFTKRHDLDTKIVTYHDLTLDPDKTMSTLMCWLDESYEAAQLSYWEFDHHGTQKREYEWVKKQKTTSHVDLRWKDELKPSQSELLLNNPDFNDYIKVQNLLQLDNGLTSTE